MRIKKPLRAKLKSKLLISYFKHITKKDDFALVAYKGAAIALFVKQEKKSKTKRTYF